VSLDTIKSSSHFRISSSDWRCVSDKAYIEWNKW